MEERDRGMTSDLRVVILCTGNGSVTQDDLPAAQCVTAASGYEAAAEVLSAPTAALVVDLRIVARGHMGLLDVARRMGTEVLAVGAVPAGLTSEDLSGVRLIARADLPAALSKLAAALGTYEPQAPAPPAETPEIETQEPDPDPAMPSPQAAPPRASDLSAHASLEHLGIIAVDDLIKEEGAYLPITHIPDTRPAPPADEPSRDKGNDPPLPPAGLLTAEELTALLEGEL